MINNELFIRDVNYMNKKYFMRPKKNDVIYCKICDGSHKNRRPSEGSFMKVVNSYFNTPKVRSFIFDLIRDYDLKDYSELTYADKTAFASILIDTAGEEAEHECIIQSDDLHEIIYFLKKSLLNSRIDEQNLISTMKNAAVDYYEEIMEALFERVLDDYETDKQEWNKYISKYGDPDDLYNRRRNAL